MNISIKQWLHWSRGVYVTTAELCNATNSRFSLISRHHPIPPRRTSHIVGDGKALLVLEPDHTIKTPCTQTVKSSEMCFVTLQLCNSKLTVFNAYSLPPSDTKPCTSVLFPLPFNSIQLKNLITRHVQLGYISLLLVSLLLFLLSKCTLWIVETCKQVSYL